MSQYRKKPVVIEAVQWPGTKFESAPPQWFIDAMHITPGQPGMVMRWEYDILIETLEGQMRAKPGDWIIRGVKGELYPCKPDIFAATYEDAAPMGQELPPHDSTGSIDANKLEAMAKEMPDECFLKGSGVLKLLSAIRHLERELAAAREVGKHLFNAVADQGELAERKQASIDSVEFHDVMDKYDDEMSYGSIITARRALIAYIDGRSAGTTPAGYKLVPLVATKDMLHAGMRYFSGRREPATEAWQVYQRMIAAAPTPTNSGREEANAN
jgi:hypothetical protein